MIESHELREKELTRIREEIIRTTKEIIRLARKGAQQVRGRSPQTNPGPRRTDG